MGTDWKEAIPPVTTERENTLWGNATVCSALNNKMQKSAEMTDSAFGGNNWPGDTDLDEGDWRTIDCRVVTDAPPSSFDPTATIGGWASYRFHQTVTLPPATGLNTQRTRWIDSVPAIQ